MSRALADKLKDVDARQRAGVAIEPRQKTTRDLVQEMEPQFRRALPAHVDAARFTRLALTALRTVPKLAECSGESVLAGLMQAAHLGLEIDAVRGQAYLIPRWNGKTGRNEASFQLGYKGLIDLAGRGGITVRARDVCEHDLFEFEDGLVPKLRHMPELKKERGDAWAYFAVATFSDERPPEFVVMSRAEVERHRDRFASAKNRSGTIVGPWVEHFDAMARKTAIIKLLGQLPLPVEVVEALSMEDVPLDVTPEERELPAAASDGSDSDAAAGPDSAPPGGEGAEGGDEPPRAQSPPSEAERAAVELEERRELARYMADEARKADLATWKAWAGPAGIPNDSRKWSATQIDGVIAWVTEEPNAEEEEGS
jgi:recombination protein RecT